MALLQTTIHNFSLLLFTSHWSCCHGSEHLFDVLTLADLSLVCHLTLSHVYLWHRQSVWDVYIPLNPSDIIWHHYRTASHFILKYTYMNTKYCYYYHVQLKISLAEMYGTASMFFGYLCVSDNWRLSRDKTQACKGSALLAGSTTVDVEFLFLPQK